MKSWNWFVFTVLLQWLSENQPTDHCYNLWGTSFTKIYIWSKFLNFSWQEMHISLFFLEKKEWNLKCFHSFREMKSEIKMPWNRDREWKVKWKCPEIEIEKWNWKKILENSRETRLSQGTDTVCTGFKRLDQVCISHYF